MFWFNDALVLFYTIFVVLWRSQERRTSNLFRFSRKFHIGRPLNLINLYNPLLTWITSISLLCQVDWRWDPIKIFSFYFYRVVGVEKTKKKLFIFDQRIGCFIPNNGHGEKTVSIVVPKLNLFRHYSNVSKQCVFLKKNKLNKKSNHFTLNGSKL